MTRKEAIKVITSNDVFDADLIYEAVSMAIKALEQNPCEDAISRQAVLNLFNKSDNYSWEMSWLKRKIEKISSVKPQEPILEKIRDEISQLPSYVAKFAGGSYAIHIDKEKVLQIIDKYRKGE